MQNPNTPKRWTKTEILESLKEVLTLEALALQEAALHLPDSFIDAVELLSQCKGKIVVTGMGKSGLIGRKIAATLASTGSPSLFLHPAEAMHGDLGVLQSEDILLAIGKSGESEELLGLLPSAKRIGVKLLALTSNPKSSLAQKADIVLEVIVKKEACPHDLAPTTSTTLALAIGDALALTLMKIKNFQPAEFALYHPGGRLGKRLLLSVEDVMIEYSHCPILNPKTSSMQDALLALGSFSLGLVLFSEDGKKLDGILTDGDIRDLLKIHGKNFFELSILNSMNTSPLSISPQKKAIDALEFMEKRKKPLNVLPALDGQGQIKGLLRLHELLKLF
jgi:arabinose-5-phosphate isomerase